MHVWNFHLDAFIYAGFSLGVIDFLGRHAWHRYRRGRHARNFHTWVFPIHSILTCSHNPANRTTGLTSELLLGRYALEPPRYPDSLLAQHEKGLFSELHASLATAPSHRSAAYDREILPRSLSLIQAIGHRIAYDAARASRVDGPLLDLFEIVSVSQDEAWYIERLGFTRAELREREARALEAVFPRLEEYLARMDVAPYVVAPIVSDERWKQFVGTLQTFGETTSSAWDAEVVGAFLYGDDSSTAQPALQMSPHRSVRSML